jgi:hypothetical protein
MLHGPEMEELLEEEMEELLEEELNISTLHRSIAARTTRVDQK